MRLIDADALIEKWYEANNIGPEDRGAIFIGYTEIPRFINNAPTVEPTGDSISRADAIEAVEKEDCCGWIECKAEKIYDRINALPSAETHEIRTETHGVCSNLISRADAIKELDEYFEHIKIIDKRGLKRIEPISRDVKGIVDALPSAEAYFTDGNKIAEWIFNPTDAIDLMFAKPKCSRCGFESSDGGNYCSNCGAKMKGGAE